MTQEQTTDGFWAILELMGHTKLAGYITEESKFGTALGRIDIPGPDDTTTTQYFAGSAIYRLTPTTEEIARATATAFQPRPVQIWEVPALQEASRRVLDRAPRHDDDSDDPDDDGDFSLMP